MVERCFLDSVKPGVRKLIRLFCAINPLIDNSHYGVSSLVSSRLAETLELRYRRFQSSLIPQIFDHVKEKRGNPAEVVFVAFLGSASVYDNYKDIDLGVGLRGQTREPEKIMLEVVDEKGFPSRRSVESFYYDVGKIKNEEYIDFVYSKVFLFGSVPELYPQEVPQLLRAAMGRALEKYDTAPNERKAMHLLAAAFRHIYSLCKATKRKLPEWFVPCIKSLYAMEESGRYDRAELSRIRSFAAGY
jgi:hypothetical protein